MECYYSSLFRICVSITGLTGRNQRVVTSIGRAARVVAEYLRHSSRVGKCFRVGTLLAFWSALVAAGPSALIADSVRPPDGVSASDWGQIREEYERHRHVAVPDGAGYKARNHSQQWLIRFDGRGFSVQPDEGDWIWGLELVGYGFEGATRAVEGKAPIATEKNRVAYAWDETIQEWFVNDTRGLEHGFTLKQPPGGEGERLEFQLAVRGGLELRAAGSRALSFVDKSGTAVIDYAGLKVWDADGAELPARLEATAAGHVRVLVDDREANYPITVDPIAQQAYLKASNTGVFDSFGDSVAVSEDTVVVGARTESGNGMGVSPPSQADNSAEFSGAVYVFGRVGGTWSQQAYLKASNTDAADQFGYSVAVSGGTVVVGAPFEDSNGIGVNPPSQADNSASFSGAAYVFERIGGAWSQQAYLKASNTGADEILGDIFGYSVAVSGDTVVIGALQEGSNGTGVNPSTQNDNSAFGSGAAYVFERVSGTWSQQAYLKASNTGAGDNFGWSVAVSRDTVVVGAPFEASSGEGVNPPFQADNSAFASGAVYVFERVGGEWSQQAYLKASNTDAADVFGWSVAVSGETLVVGAAGEASNGEGVSPSSQADNSAPNAGAAYVFERSSEVWSQQAYLKGSNSGEDDLLGLAVAISGDTVVVGAPREDSSGTGMSPSSQADNSAPNAGAAYVFERVGGAWSQQAYIKASNTGADDEFGSSVAVSGDTVVVGAPFEASNGTGVNPPSQADNSALFSGAAYAFTLTNQPPTANAGPNQRVVAPGPSGLRVTLDGSRSSDPDGDSLTYNWTGPFRTRTSVSPTVEIPGGIHTVTLMVDDGRGGVDTDTVTITVRTLAVTPRTLNVRVEQGTGAVSKPFTVRALGGSVNYSIARTSSWLDSDPKRGESSGESDTVQAVVDPTGLEPGTYTRSLIVNGPSVIRQRLEVTLTVSAGSGPAPLTPKPFANGVVDAADFIPFGEPGHAVTPKSIVSIFGADFVRSGEYRAETIPLPTTLGGVIVLFDGIRAPLFFVSPGVIIAQIPMGLTPPTATMVIIGGENGAAASAPQEIQVAGHSPGIFTLSQDGKGQGIAVHTGSADLAAPLGAVGNSRPASEGDRLTIYANGLGPVEPPIADGQNSCDPGSECLPDFSNLVLRRTTTRPVVTIGGVRVPAEDVVFSGLAPLYVGVNELIVRLPKGVPSGDAVSIVIRMGETQSRLDVTIAVE